VDASAEHIRPTDVIPPVAVHEVRRETITRPSTAADHSQAPIFPSQQNSYPSTSADLASFLHPSTQLNIDRNISHIARAARTATRKASNYEPHQLSPQSKLGASLVSRCGPTGVVIRRGWRPAWWFPAPNTSRAGASIWRGERLALTSARTILITHRRAGLTSFLEACLSSKYSPLLLILCSRRSGVDATRCCLIPRKNPRA
jgi:hypothetical protein